MPAIVGGIKVLSVGSGAVVNIGDSLYISPKSTSKTYAGSGSFNTGDLPVTNNGLNATLTTDNDVGGLTGENESSTDT
jgi:spore germination protein PF